MKTKTLTIQLPVSEEALGRWLEDNHAKIEITCSLGNYHVYLKCHSMLSYKEAGDVSVRHSGDIEVSVYGKSFDDALKNAMNTMALALDQKKVKP